MKNNFLILLPHVFLCIVQVRYYVPIHAKNVEEKKTPKKDIFLYFYIKMPFFSIPVK